MHKPPRRFKLVKPKPPATAKLAKARLRPRKLEVVPPTPPPSTAIVVPMPTPAEVDAIIQRHTWAAATAMFAIPLPGADVAATFAVWGAMIREIAAAYGERLDQADGVRLASQLFRNAALTGFAWFGSAKVATSILKFLPIGGTVTAYAVDAAVAAVGAKRITASVGRAAALYYGTGKRVAPRTLREHVRVLSEDPALRAHAEAVLRERGR